MPLKYHDITPYKYRVAEDYTINLERWGINPSIDILGPGISLKVGGDFTLHKGWLSDGPSGPTIDHPSFMRGALLHDGGYELIRLGLIDPSWRERFDHMLKGICVESGMCEEEAETVFLAVRAFGGSCIHRDSAMESQDVILSAP